MGLTKGRFLSELSLMEGNLGVKERMRWLNFKESELESRQNLK